MTSKCFFSNMIKNKEKTPILWHHLPIHCIKRSFSKMKLETQNTHLKDTLITCYCSVNLKDSFVRVLLFISLLKRLCKLIF